MGSNVSQTIKILESGMGSLYATVKIFGGIFNYFTRLSYQFSIHNQFLSNI